MKIFKFAISALVALAVIAPMSAEARGKGKGGHRGGHHYRMGKGGGFRGHLPYKQTCWPDDHAAGKCHGKYLM